MWAEGVADLKLPFLPRGTWACINQVPGKPSAKFSEHGQQPAPGQHCLSQPTGTVWQNQVLTRIERGHEKTALMEKGTWAPDPLLSLYFRRQYKREQMQVADLSPGIFDWLLCTTPTLLHCFCEITHFKGSCMRTPVQSSSALQYTRTTALSSSVLSIPTAREPSVWIFKTASLKFWQSWQVAQISHVLRAQKLPDEVALTYTTLLKILSSCFTLNISSQISL